MSAGREFLMKKVRNIMGNDSATYLSIGSKVKIDRCESCPAVVGKTAKITSFKEEPGFCSAVLNFGRGRPQANRPVSVPVVDLSVAEESSDNDKR